MDLELPIAPTTGCFPVESLGLLFGAGELPRRLPGRAFENIVIVRG